MVLELPEAHALREEPGWFRSEYDACAQSCARCKGQAIESNVEEMMLVEGECHHLHEHGEWKPWSVGGEKDRWLYPSKEEAEYSAVLAFNIAVASSWWAVRVKSVRMRIMKAPGVMECGSRVGWLQADSWKCRRRAMCGVAVGLGLKPPPVRPGKWFPEEQVGDTMGARICAEEKVAKSCVKRRFI